MPILTFNLYNSITFTAYAYFLHPIKMNNRFISNFNLSNLLLFNTDPRINKLNDIEFRPRPIEHLRL